MQQQSPDMHTYQCPTCHSAQLVISDNESYLCDNASCGRQYPVSNGLPILICEERSLFSFNDFSEGAAPTTMNLLPTKHSSIERIRETLKKCLPSKSYNVSQFGSTDAVRYICSRVENASILVIGAGEDPVETQLAANMTFSDVTRGPLTDLIADGHDLPFPDNSFDGVLAVAVMEHVIDPSRVASEAWRVLKPNGAIYASTPFMQQVHMGRYDFHRFTPLGHRRLWRWFDEEKSGIANGPAMALVWSVDYFLRTLFRQNALQSSACYSARMVLAPLLLLDRVLANRAGAFDAASAHYFFGFKRDTPVPDKDIVRNYPGAQ